MNIIHTAVVLQEGVCGVRDSSGGRGRRLGAVVAVGGVQQDVWRGRLLLCQTLWQPQVQVSAGTSPNGIVFVVLGKNVVFVDRLMKLKFFTWLEISGSAREIGFWM